MSPVARLQLYKDALLTWTSRVNLIGPEARRNLDGHIAEAIEAARVLRPDGEVLDFGSGGGLPAIPMAITSPEARFHLVEADQKKWAFLKYVVRECALNSLVYGDRLERLVSRLQPGSFSLVTSRAVGNPQVWIPSLRSRLAPGGRVALFQHHRDAPDVEGFELSEIVPLSRGESNYLVILQLVSAGTI